MKQMKKQARALALALAVLGCFLSLSACSGGETLVTESSGCVNQKTGVRYLHAPIYYEPITLGESYGTLKTSQNKLELFQIEGLDAEKWLSTEEKDVLYAEGLELPTLAEMEPTLLHVWLDGATNVRLDDMEDAEAIRSVVKQFEEGTALETMPSGTPYVRTIRFESDKLPGLYYKLSYLEYDVDVEENGVNYGRYFLYRNWNPDRRIVPVDDTLHNFINNIPVETDTAADTTAAP